MAQLSAASRDRANRGSLSWGVSMASIRSGDYVKLPDGRIGRARGTVGRAFKIRVRRKTSETHQFVLIRETDLQRVDCPKGWMSPNGYRRYLLVTLEKMRQRMHHS